MHKITAYFTLLALTVVTGCTQGTSGGPGVTANKPILGQEEDTFNLSVPMLATSLQQGAKLEATVGIQRAKNFDEDVTLKFVDLPKGVTIQPASPLIKHGDQNTKITLQAGDEAALGSFQIKVTGHPTKGSDAQVDFKLTIAAKDTFTLSTPRSTSLKQGEAETLVISIKRDKSFDQDVALSFSEMPAGVTLDPSTPVIKSGEEEAHVTITGADDAALGNFTVMVTGHPTKGADASHEIKLTVVAK